jgi:hypothetical protein
MNVSGCLVGELALIISQYFIRHSGAGCFRGLAFGLAFYWAGQSFERCKVFLGQQLHQFVEDVMSSR